MGTAERGVAIGPGYVKNKGPVDVFQCTSNPKMLWCLTRRDEWILVARARVHFTKGKS